MKQTLTFAFIIGTIFMMACGSQPKTIVPNETGMVGDNFKPCAPSPNCISTMTENMKQFMEPFSYGKFSKDVAKEKLIEYLKTQKHFTLLIDDEDYIHGTWKVPPFNFIDDVEFYFPPDEKVIHMKSSSRVGYSDIGENKRRLKKINKALGKMML